VNILTPRDTDSAIDNEDMILQVLKDYYPDLDVGPGTPFYEMVIRPNAFLWTKHTDGMRELLAANTFSDPTNMQQADLDRLMTRYFQTRKVGVTVYGTIRLILNTYQNYTISAGTMFQASNNRVYYTTSDVVLSASELTGSATGGYVLDLAVESQYTGNLYNAKATEAVTPPSSLLSFVTRCYFATDTTDGGVTESNSAFYSRVQNSMSLQNLTTYKGVQSLLRTKFNLSDLVVVGLRDPEMKRDIYELPTATGVVSVHRGGMADFYVRNDPYVLVSGYQAPLGFPYYYNGSSMAIDGDALMEQWNALNITNVNIDMRGSVYETLPLSIKTSMTTLTSSILEIQNFVSDMSNEAIHSDNIIKQEWPLVVTASFTITDSAGDSAVSLAKTAAATYINGLTGSNAPQVDDLITAVKAAGVKKVNLPITLAAYYLKEDAKIEKIGTDLLRSPVTSVLKPLKSDSLSFSLDSSTQISLRTAFFYTNTDLISVTSV